MTLQNIIDSCPCAYIEIEVRSRHSNFLEEDLEISDMLVGYCYYEDGELFSLDGDDYSLDVSISNYEWGYADGNEGQLTIWLK